MIIRKDIKIMTVLLLKFSMIYGLDVSHIIYFFARTNTHSTNQTRITTIHTSAEGMTNEHEYY